MAAAHDGTANVTATIGGANSVTITNKTTTGSDRLGVCGMGGFLGASGTTSATWNGVAMTVSQLGANGDAIQFHLAAPATAASSVTISNLNVASGTAVASSYTGVDQTTPLGDAATASATSNAPSVTVTTATGDMVVDAGVVQQGQATVGANQTQILNTGTGPISLASYQLGADGGVMSWASAPSTYWEFVATSYTAAAGGGGGGTILPQMNARYYH